MSQMIQIFDRLREEILSLSLAPGEKLTERGLETRFAMSRTPVRAALLRLEGEGLVHRQGRNWVVAPLDLSEIIAIAEFRLPLETTAVRLACTRRVEADLNAIANMLEACRPNAPREEWHRLGTEFHIAIAKLSGNALITKALAEAMVRLHRVRWLEVSDEASRERAWNEHHEILTLIRKRDAAAAEAAIAAHITETRDRLLAALQDDRERFRAHGFKIIGAD
ncbi:MAG: GntR family transcriptional regulator [Proteobacteria bacterium]|nr:GntR family transcriptional regulator [Pseudomonadota bacterium]